MINPHIFSIILSNNTKPHFFPSSVSVGIFSSDEIERLINNTALTGNNLRLFKDTIELKSAKVPGLWNKELTDLQVIQDALSAGYGFSITNVSRVNKDINSVCEVIERSYRETNTDAHIYSGNESFIAHWDPPDNFILQQSGHCRWIVYNECATEIELQVDKILRREPSLTVDIEVMLNPGDVLFIPKHRYHKCIPQGDRLSISIPVPDVKLNFDRRWIKMSR